MKAFLPAAVSALLVVVWQKKRRYFKSLFEVSRVRNEKNSFFLCSISRRRLECFKLGGLVVPRISPAHAEIILELCSILKNTQWVRKRKGKTWTKRFDYALVRNRRERNGFACFYFWWSKMQKKGYVGLAWEDLTLNAKSDMKHTKGKRFWFRVYLLKRCNSSKGISDCYKTKKWARPREGKRPYKHFFACWRGTFW